MRVPKLLGPVAIAASLIQSALALREHWGLLSPAERKQLRELLRKSRGRPRGLSAAERRELSRLVAKLELLRLGRRLASTAGPLPGRGRRAA